ncbi:E3 SUMO-protein ligase PIAS3-like [Metopolophium dirhodum]|uniref:E3 SUMO-protein ligase PIAS3-like n=1 Tax=Metopolophium dirhodum TaxID=44670 RepID=UPI00298FE9A4|nr:E3 SUMO-protein ligase PIAS3-like [Metopolophium dirhodum]XP_060867867.1 E3 SUMO-protein ligase PIAS3-like [Metopolophium dirhodum]
MPKSCCYMFADIEYIQQVIYDLRLNELQQILEAVKQNQFGSIQCLRKRVLSLLTDPALTNINLKHKILQVYNTRPQRNQQPQQRPQLLREPRNNLQIHSQSYIPPRPNPTQPFVEIVSPDIRFEHLPFFRTVQSLFKPVYCQTKTDSVDFTGIFHLTENVRHNIVNSWNTARQEYKIQIILRLLQVGLNENVTERLPYNITVSVNDRQCNLPTLNFPNIMGIAPWHCNIPIDITQQTDLGNSAKNTLKITWTNEPHKFMAGVFVARRLTWNDLLEELKKRPKRSSDKTKELIKKSMESEADMGVESVFATVKDPLTKLRMKLPARGVDCIHLQCFDAIQFLQMNEQKEKWTCPLCKKKMKFENIEIDEYFFNILNSPVLSEECESILLFKDGTWTYGKNNIGFSNNSRTNDCGSTNNIEVFTLSDSDDDNDADNSTSYVANVDNDEIIPKSKCFKYSPSKVKESEHGIENEDLTNPSESDLSDERINGDRSRPLIESTSMLNNVDLPNISNPGSNNCVAGSSGSSRNNRHQEKDNSRSVLCVITLD